jgi:hypothetical protein
MPVGLMQWLEAEVRLSRHQRLLLDQEATVPPLSSRRSLVETSLATPPLVSMKSPGHSQIGFPEYPVSPLGCAVRLHHTPSVLPWGPKTAAVYMEQTSSLCISQ